MSEAQRNELDPTAGYAGKRIMRWIWLRLYNEDRLCGETHNEVDMAKAIQ